MSGIKQQQSRLWLDRCRANIEKFRQNRHALSEEEQTEFIRNQQVILQAWVKVIKGHARFEGV